ncbi:MAG: TIGR03557 family F420-dependent LLM class oxidoreductase [Methanomicrobiaceae archaeon]|uniref:Luciferase-like domain-containing protein n=1 Tax=hydrocarbon metagenome TaxID=938273 RepID=A0A0W8FGQ4_9ZZZZ|nr:TIGR03557 family F420-dependent LLM class oxidoreductase [Methanomicrobiaceae archaeon]MDD5420448.1 TIGR03557 family F420-dependent LLM class oxidoreductase [Methanomicrobiaceae archaeon]
MVEIGYKLCSEEHGPLDLVCCARQIEDAGFDYSMVSDHFHPWIGRQGESPCVWCTLGGISQVTSRLQIATGVTCPTMRTRPAIIAHAAATAAAMLPGRFSLGVGSGEYLNEHISGDHWPPAPVRMQMLEEAVEIIRRLWTGEEIDHEGVHYTVENARLYTLPETLPPILVAAEGEIGAEAAGRIGDGLVNAGSNEDQAIRTFRDAEDEGTPAYLEISVCYAETEKEAERIAFAQWPIAANTGELNRILSTPAHYEQLAMMVSQKDVAEKVVCGRDPERYIDEIHASASAGYDHITILNIGPYQHEFIEFCRDSILPALV